MPVQIQFIRRKSLVHAIKGHARPLVVHILALTQLDPNVGSDMGSKPAEQPVWLTGKAGIQPKPCGNCLVIHPYYVDPAVVFIRLQLLNVMRMSTLLNLPPPPREIRILDMLSIAGSVFMRCSETNSRLLQNARWDLRIGNHRGDQFDPACALLIVNTTIITLKQRIIWLNSPIGKEKSIREFLPKNTHRRYHYYRWSRNEDPQLNFYRCKETPQLKMMIIRIRSAIIVIIVAAP